MGIIRLDTCCHATTKMDYNYHLLWKYQKDIFLFHISHEAMACP